MLINSKINKLFAMEKHLTQLLKPITFGLCLKTNLGLASVNDAKSVKTYLFMFRA